jgi:hypothetical protein
VILRRMPSLRMPTRVACFTPSREMTSTISDLAPYASVKGSILRFFTYSLGVRQDEVWFSNKDRLVRTNSYPASSRLTSPRGTVSFQLPNHPKAPS